MTRLLPLLRQTLLPGAACVARAACAASLCIGALAPDAWSQRFLVPHNSPRAQIALVDGTAGALIDGAWIDVSATAVPPLTSDNVLRDVERVGDTVWVAGGSWVYRYDLRTRDLIDSFDVGASVRSIEAVAGRVLLTTRRGISVRNAVGAPLTLVDVTGASDTLSLFDGTMLVAIANSARVERYTVGGVLLGTFAGPSVPTPFGLMARPSQLARRRNGNVLVCGDVRVYEFAIDGSFVGEYDLGPFEGGVAETYSTRLIVPLGTGMAVFDAQSGASVAIGGGFFGQGRKVGLLDRGNTSPLANGDAFSEVTCAGTIDPATGTAARLAVIGSSVADEEVLDVFGDRLPAGALTMLAVGRTLAGELTPGGLLCIDRRTLFIAPTPVAANSDGLARYTLAGPGQNLIKLMPGMTIHAQLLYRTGSTFRLSSSVGISLSR